MNALNRVWIVLVLCLSVPIAEPAAAAALDPNAYSSLGTLNVSSGTLTFDTDALQVTGGGALGSTMGVLQPQGGGNPDIAVFTFDDVTVGSSVSFQIAGSRPVAILSQLNLLIDANVVTVGAHGTDGAGFAAAAPDGPNGQNGTSGSSSGGNGGPAPVADQPGGKGGNGGYNLIFGQDGSDGSGGAAGGNGGDPSTGPFDDGGTGGTGGNGSNGVQGPSGTGGVGATGGASFALVGGSNGNTGTTGISGRGGGGGGGGGGGLDGGPFFLNGDRGGGGGAGGAGGSGGPAGQGGQGGRAIEFVAVGTASFNGSLSSAGGDGGDGAAGQLGGAGGTGGLGPDNAGPGGPGGKGGNGGAGGAGGGGAGGTIFLSAGTLNVPASPVQLAGGAFATNPSGGVSMPGGAGLFRFEGTLNFDVTSSSSYEQLSVVGSIDPAGDVHFNFADEAIADAFASTFTLDHFFAASTGPVGPLANYMALNYSGSSPTRQFAISLLADRTFSVSAAVPEPGTAALVVIALGMFQRLNRRANRRT